MDRDPKIRAIHGGPLKINHRFTWFGKKERGAIKEDAGLQGLSSEEIAARKELQRLLDEDPDTPDFQCHDDWRTK